MFAGREKARRGGSKRDPITQQHSSFFFPSFFVRRLPGAISSMRGGKPSSSPPTTEKPKRRSLVPNVTWTTSGSSWPFCNENSVILFFSPIDVCLSVYQRRLASSNIARVKAEISGLAQRARMSVRRASSSRGNMVTVGGAFISPLVAFNQRFRVSVVMRSDDAVS